MSSRAREIEQQITKIYQRVDGDGVVSFLLYLGSAILTLLGLYFLIISTNLDFVNEGNSLGNRGRFVGGTAGSIWAFAGVLLFVIVLRSHNKQYKLTRSVLEKQTDQLQSLQDLIHHKENNGQLSTDIVETTQDPTSNESRIDSMIAILIRYLQQSSSDTPPEMHGRQLYQYLKDEFLVHDIEQISEKKLKKLKRKFPVFSGFQTLFLSVYQEIKDLIKQEDEETKAFFKSKLIKSLRDSEIALLSSTLSSFVDSDDDLAELQSLLQIDNVYQMHAE